jgi:hypothetical protein
MNTSTNMAMGPASKGPARGAPPKKFFAPVIKNYIHKQSFMTGAKKFLLGFMEFLLGFYGIFIKIHGVGRGSSRGRSPLD